MSLLSGIWQYLCAAALAVGLALGAWGMSRWDAGKIAGLELRANRAESVAAVWKTNAATEEANKKSCEAALATAIGAADSWATQATEAQSLAEMNKVEADRAAAEARRLAALHSTPLPTGCEDAVMEFAKRIGP